MKPTRYREAARSAGFDPAGLPISTTSVMYVAKDSQTALSEYYPYINNVTVQVRGSGYPEQQFLAATDYQMHSRMTRALLHQSGLAPLNSMLRRMKYVTVRCF